MNELPSRRWRVHWLRKLWTSSDVWLCSTSEYSLRLRSYATTNLSFRSSVTSFLSFLTFLQHAYSFFREPQFKFANGIAFGWQFHVAVRRLRVVS